MPNVASANFKIFLALKRAKIAPLVITKLQLGQRRIALDAFLDNFKIKKATEVVLNVRVVVNSMLALMLVFLLQIAKRVQKVNTKRRKDPRFVFRV